MAELFARQRGAGRPLIFIHGFPMHQAVWNDFGEHFSKTHTVITPDLPGFGKSAILPPGFSLEDVAKQLLDFLVSHNLVNGVVIGHSLGGYVALAMVAQAPDLFAGLGLFHSTAYPDSAEKKDSRNKVIEFVEKNGAQAFTTNFITPLFADPSHPDVALVKRIASPSSAEAVIGYTKAMRDRRDQVKTLKSFKKPTLFLAGEKDPGIPPDTIYTQAEGIQPAEIHVLQQVAHMGMFEKPEESATKIKGFLSKI